VVFGLGHQFGQRGRSQKVRQGQNAVCGKFVAAQRRKAGINKRMGIKANYVFKPVHRMISNIRLCVPVNCP
jgi:hypothetical protein